MDSSGVHRPRNLDWTRAAALLYGDWGTSKAYVIGLAFVAAAYSALPIIVAVCLLTALVGYNYIIICKHFPDGGGVYSAARTQNRVLAVMGAWLLVANFTVTAALSGWAAVTYLGVPYDLIRTATLTVVVAVGVLNFFGPKHSGSVAVSLAVPMVVAVVAIIVLSIPHLTFEHLKPSTMNFREKWIALTQVILALSGVEAIANLTGVMKLDPRATMDNPKVAVTARKSIIPVALEVVLVTTLLGWAMLSIPDSFADQLLERWADMLRFLAEHYGAIDFGMTFSRMFGFIVGLIVGLLLLSAVNTAVGALIGLLYMMARDGEMPKSFLRLNSYGVPRWPLIISVVFPFVVTLIVPDLKTLASLYAIGVVGAITVNVGSCTFNWRMHLAWYERIVMGLTFLVLFAAEITIAWKDEHALFFAVVVVGTGLALRTYSQRRAGLRTLTVSEDIAAAVAPETSPGFRLNLTPTQTILVAARGVTPVLRFALDEARLRQATLYVLYVKELAVTVPGTLASLEAPRWQHDRQAREIMYTMLALGKENGVTVIPLYAVSDDPAGTILDQAATMGADLLMLGSRHRRTLAGILKGDIVTAVANNLPENIQLIIYG